jgi:predicted secreted hydrolase
MKNLGTTRRDFLKTAAGLGLLALAPPLMTTCTGSPCTGESQLDAETYENIASVLWMDKYDPAEIPPDIAALLRSEKNSSQTFGGNMRYRLDELLANPDSFTPDYSLRYNTLKGYTAKLSPHQAYGINSMLGLDSSRGYQLLPKDITFSFPLDDRPQFEYQNGWHFFVGSAFTEFGEEYGIQLMFWQVSILPPQMAENVGLSTIENQICEIHFAISPAGDRHYRAKPYLVAGTTGLISFSANPFNYVIGKNFMRSLRPESLFPIQLRAWGRDNTQNNSVQIEIDLTLNQTKGYVLNGDHGLAPSCGGIGTLYYSVPNLQIDPARSVLRINGQQARLSRGKFWYDHQWGTGFTPGGNPRSEVLRAANRLKTPEPIGWDWLAIQFDDNIELALSALHTKENARFYEQTGPEPPGTMIADCNGAYIDASGSYSSINGQIHVTQWIRSTVSHGQYMATNTWYPNRVEVILDTAVIPGNRRVFTMIPIVDTGQQGFFANGAQYSEGAVYIEDPNGTKIGRGFLESPGYADMRNQMLQIAGLPQTEEMRKFVSPAEITAELKAASENFLADPTNQALFIQEYASCRGL